MNVYIIMSGDRYRVSGIEKVFSDYANADAYAQKIMTERGWPVFSVDIEKWDNDITYYWRGGFIQILKEEVIFESK